MARTDADRAASKRWYEQNKEVQYARVKKNKLEKRTWIASLKEAPCTDCGVQYPPIVMEWDHLPGTKKEFNLCSNTAAHASRERILAEVAKCELVCANCHRLRTLARMG